LSASRNQKADIEDFLIHNLWGHNDVRWIAKNPVGFSGGMLIIWNSVFFNLRNSFSGDGFLGVSVDREGDVLHIVNVYAPCNISGKKKLWEDLSMLKQQIGGGKWCVGGDFNAVLHSSERKGVSTDTRQSERFLFNCFVEEMELIDVPVLGKKFTWFSADGKSMSRIDRFLLSDGFVTKYDITGQWIGDRDISDHCPVWLLSSSVNWGPKPFRVINGWLEHPEFLSFVQNAWKSFEVHGKKAYVLKEKLKLLRDRLRNWNREVSGYLDLNIEKTVNDINNIENLFGGDDEEAELTRRDGLNKEFWRQLHHKESLLKQKSRLKWVKEGDSNSKFFHESIKNRRRRNQLVALKDGDSWVQGVAEVKSYVKNYFENNFKENWEHRPNLNGIAFNTLSEEDNLSLMAPFSVDEVREVIWSCDGNKCPGPDGYNFNFLKSCWEIIKCDIMEFMAEFHKNAVLPKAITASFLALIPKKDHPQVLSDYRPICLVSSLYKILTKVLAARLKKVMGNLISEVQSAFLPNRKILDGVLVVNELIDLAKRRKDKCLFFNVDFERACDTVNWNFLEYMLIRMGFTEGWRRWIRACVFQSSMSVLVNGSTTEDFCVGKGLRQGGPLSPFLFLIVAEGPSVVLCAERWIVVSFMVTRLVTTCLFILYNLRMIL
jgi:exonuclease III